MTDEPAGHRIYGDLAVWWPLISPPEEYAEEAAYAAGLLSSASVPVHDVPDCTAETFEPSSDHGGTDDRDGRGARYLDWTWDPDPADTWIRTEYAFVLRDASGSVQVAHETHHTGLFSRDVWLRLLADAGFHPHAVTEQTTEDRTPRELFIGHRPSAGSTLRA